MATEEELHSALFDLYAQQTMTKEDSRKYALLSDAITELVRLQRWELEEATELLALRAEVGRLREELARLQAAWKQGARYAAMWEDE